MNAAQGTTLEDVTVYAAGSGALAGVAGGNGGGGSYKGVTVIGARYGLDTRETGDSATYVAVTLINQSCAGVLQGSGSTVTMTGLRIEGAPALGGVLAGVPPASLQRDQEASAGDCVTPRAPGAATFVAETAKEGEGRHGVQGAEGGDAALQGGPSAALRQAASIVDSTIALSGRSGFPAPPCFIANASLYLSDVWVSGCKEAVVSGGRPPLHALPASVQNASGTQDADGAGAVGGGRERMSHIQLLGYGRLDTGMPSESQPWRFAFPAYQDGNRSVEGVVHLASVTGAPAHDLEARHLWTAGGVTWQTPGAVSALAATATTLTLSDGGGNDVEQQQRQQPSHKNEPAAEGAETANEESVGCGAVGDGVTDDWGALTQCLKQHLIVYLPKGFYRLSRPLVLERDGAALVGVGKTLSIIMPLSQVSAEKWLGRGGGGAAAPVVTAAAAAAARPVLDVVSLITSIV